MPYLSVGAENGSEINLYYQDYGQGRPVVLIHCWPLDSSVWEKQIPVLIAAGYRVVAYDRRGFGRSDHPSNGYDADTLTADLHALLERLDLREATLAGFSMGGVEVARYVGRYGSERVSRAVFVSSPIPYLLQAPDNPQGVDRSVFDGLQQACRQDRFAFLEGFVPGLFNLNELEGKRISKAAVQANLQVAYSASAIATHDCIAVWPTDVREDLRSFKIPALVVHGLADPNTPFALTGQRMQEFLPDVTTVTIDDGPHALIWTHAERFNEELLAFLRVEG